MSSAAAYNPSVPPATTTPYVADAVLPRRSAPGLALAGIAALLVAAWGGILPYVGPLFGFGATGTGAWTWSTSHLVLALAPGAVGVLAALMIVPAARRLPLGTGRSSAIMGGLLAVLAGAWFAIGFATWPVWNSRGYFVLASPMRTMDVLIAYALGPGIIVAACGAYAIGHAMVRRSVPLVDPAGFPVSGRHLRTVPLGQPEPGPAAPVAGTAGPEVAYPAGAPAGSIPAGAAPVTREAPVAGAAPGVGSTAVPPTAVPPTGVTAPPPPV